MEQAKAILNQLLVKTFNTILYLEEKNLKEQGVDISMNEMHLLSCIQNTTDNSMHHIAEELLITPGTLTTNAKTLIQKGYLERRKTDKDKRIVRLYITEKALPLLAIHDAFHENMIENILKDINVQEDEAFMHVLENIIVYFEDVKKGYYK